MSGKLLVWGLVLLVTAGAVQIGAEVARAANVAITASGSAFEDGDGDENTTIQAGDVVTWSFTDGQPHSVTSDTGAFDSGAPQTSGTFQFTFNSAGTFDYYCTVHGLPGQGMHGTITVQGAATNTPPAATNTSTGATNTPTRTSTPSPTSTGTVTAVPSSAAATSTPVEAVPISATEPPPASGGAAPSVTAPAVGTGDGASQSGFRVETLTIALGVIGALMIAGAAAARLRD